MGLTPLSQWQFQVGMANNAFQFAQSGDPSGAHNDWHQWHVPFNHDMLGDKSLIRVIITPNDRGVAVGDHIAAPVGIVRNVTNQGFTIDARNSDVTGGGASFDWVAFAPFPYTTKEYPSVRLRTLQPRRYEPNGWFGDTINQPITIDNDPADVYRFLTATNLGVSGFNAPVVGIAQAVDQHSSNLHSRNSGSAGECAFSYIQATQPAWNGDGKNLLIDSDSVAGDSFEIYPDVAPFSWANSWQTLDVYFTQPYSTAPIVLLTANDNVSAGKRVIPAVGIAQNVTPYGFTLTAQNSDFFVNGICGFYWVSVGCAAGCA